MVKPWLKARGISGNKENRKGQKDFRRLPQAGCLGLESGEVFSLWLKHYRRRKSKCRMEIPRVHIIMKVWVAGVHAVTHDQKVCLEPQLLSKPMGGCCLFSGAAPPGPAGGCLETKGKTQESNWRAHTEAERGRDLERFHSHCVLKLGRRRSLHERQPSGNKITNATSHMHNAPCS